MQIQQLLRQVDSDKLDNSADFFEDDRLSSWRYFIDLSPEKNALHIWEDTGRASLAISEWANCVFSLHRNFEEVATLKQTSQGLKNNNIHFVCSQYENIPVKKDSFDVLIFEMSQESVQNRNNGPRQGMLRQAVRAMQNGGQFLLLVPNPSCLYHLLKRNKPKGKCRRKDCFYLNRFLSSHKETLIKCGLRNVTIAYFYQGPLGEVYCLYGNNHRALNYYYRNFTSTKNFQVGKRIVYNMIARTGIYKLLADTYIFIASK